MKQHLYGLMVGLGVWVLAVPGTAQEHSHAHHASSEETLSLDHGSKWRTDAAFKEGLTRMRDHLAALGDAPPDGTQAHALAQRLRGEVGFILERCKLEPAADQQAHLLLGQILDGIAALEKPDATRAVTGLRHALELYPAYFDHPGWVPLPASPHGPPPPRP